MVRPDGTITTFAGNGTNKLVNGATLPRDKGDGGPEPSQASDSPPMSRSTRGDVYIGEVAFIRKVLSPFTMFRSPNGNIFCGIVDDLGRGAYVHCQSLNSPQSVTLYGSGTSKSCTGSQCLAGSPRAAGGVLGYGNETARGRFRCLSQSSGVRCTVIRTGKGFLINATGITKVG